MYDLYVSFTRGTFDGAAFDDALCNSSDIVLVPGRQFDCPETEQSMGLQRAWVESDARDTFIFPPVTIDDEDILSDVRPADGAGGSGVKQLRFRILVWLQPECRTCSLL